MESQPYEIKWPEHDLVINTVFFKYLIDATFCDVVLSSEGNFVPCHKIVLSATSYYFHNIFKSNVFSESRERPVIVFNDIKMVDLCAILNYAYTGHVDIPQQQLQTFLQAALTLQMKGVLEQQVGGLDQQTSNQIPTQQPVENQAPDPQHRTQKSQTQSTMQQTVQFSQENNVEKQKIFDPLPLTPSRISKVFFGQSSNNDSNIIELVPLSTEMPKLSMDCFNFGNQRSTLDFQLVKNEEVPLNDKKVPEYEVPVAEKRQTKAPRYLSSFQVPRSVVLRQSSPRALHCKYCDTDTSSLPGSSNARKRFTHESHCVRNPNKNNGKAECPICSKLITPSYISTHIKRMHKTTLNTCL